MRVKGNNNMKWKTPATPKREDTRTVQYFALLPVVTSDGFTVWLEFYYADEKWVECVQTGIAHWKTVKTRCK